MATEASGVSGDGSAMESDVHDEVAFHLEMQIRALVEAGWSEAEARAEARRLFGDVGAVEQKLLGMDRRRARRRWWANQARAFAQDVRHAFRHLRKRPGFAAVAVVTLGLGIGANAAVFGLVDGALFRALPFPSEGELVVVYDTQVGESGFPASVPEYDDWSRESDFSSAMVAIATNQATWATDGPPEQLLAGVILGGDLLPVLGLRPVIGRGFDAGEISGAAKVVMLEESFWSERFGRRSSVIGETIRLDREPYTIIGVLPRAVAVLHGTDPPAIWMPVERAPFMTRGLHFLRVLARLRPGLAPGEAESRAETVAGGLRETGVTTHGIALRPLREVLVGDARSALLILFGAVTIVLLIVCANVANLVLAQSMTRSREFAVRVSLGAGSLRLARQVITESVVLGMLGGSAGFAVSIVVSRLVKQVSLQAATLAVPTRDPRVLLYTLAISIGVALLFGLWPAMRIASSNLADSLRAAGDARSLGGRDGLRRRRALAGVEIALSLVLLAGAGLLVRSMMKLMEQDTGFDARNVLTMAVALPPGRIEEPRMLAIEDELLERIRALPGVRSAGIGSHLPLGGDDTNGSFDIVGREFPPNEGPGSKKRIVSPGWFETLGVPLLRGRDFDERDRPGAAEVVIISRAVAERWWPGEDPLGRRIRFSWGSDGEQEIVGVVGDVLHDGLDQPVDGMIYRPAAQFIRPGFQIAIRVTGDPMTFVRPIRSAMREIDPDVPIASVRTMARVVADSVAPRRRTMALFTAFAALALLLATVGVYAIAAQAVVQRTNEIGLRMAMGARSTDVLRLVLVQELPVIAIGSVAGLLAAVAGTRLLRASLFEISPADPLVFAAACLILFTVAMTATLIPARRASRLDPLTALRRD